METGVDCDVTALLCALSFATGLGLGAQMDHGPRTAILGSAIAERMGLAQEDREAVFYGALLKDVGCTACAAGIAAFFPDDELAPRLDMMLIDPTSLGSLLGWLTRNVPLDSRLPLRLAKMTTFAAQCGPVIREAMRGHCEIADLFARRLGFRQRVQQAVRFQAERWDGKGLAYGLRGEETPVAARILHAAQVLELAVEFGGVEAAAAMARERAGTRFDPAVTATFLALLARPEFRQALEEEPSPEALRALQPGNEALAVEADPTETICAAVADFIDVKTLEAPNHSRRVAEVAEAIGTALGLSRQERHHLRRAGLVHDVGKVAVPFGILGKATRSAAEWEQYRLHPYYTQRVLERVGALRQLAPSAAAHHEALDGSGYHRGLHTSQIPRAGRILAVANYYAHHRHDRDSTASDDEVLVRLRAESGSRFDPDCVAALADALGAAAPSRRPRERRSPEELTERELEVLRLLAQGRRNPEIAETLFVSRKTVEHHLEHIYGKLGVTTRTAAVAYAVQHQLA